ncbi:MAG: response regulator [Candidatus Lokiarchaeota archaeon]|nr:response regulator [Candidatus Lokiarchaeota archaeon]MBD3343293.1 response regulator [Candidatus Lokiarchaeota archaeon]
MNFFIFITNIKTLNFLILLVDKDEFFLNKTKILLKKNDFDVLIARNGNGALNILQKEISQPNLIISDINIPEMNGMKLFLELTKNPKWNKIPFIFLTELSSPEEIRAGKQLGVDDYLIKPISEDDLIAVIKGKLLRSQTKKVSIKQIEKVKSIVSRKSVDSKEEDENKNNLIFIYIHWDKVLGPIINQYYSLHEPDFQVEKIASQIIHGYRNLIPGNKNDISGDLLITLPKLNKRAFILFDGLPKKSNEQFFMIGLIASTISYEQSINLRQIMDSISNKIKKGDIWKITDFWDEINLIFSKH